MKRRFLYSESKLAELTGISRTDIIKLRKEMVKGKDWRKSKRGKGGSIELSQGAVDIILKTFGLSDTDPAPARLHFGKTAKRTIDPKQETQPESSWRIEGNTCDTTQGFQVHSPAEIKIEDCVVLKLLKVTSLPPNKRIVKAVNGTGQVYDVIVPDNTRWAIGNRLRAKQSGKHIGYLELIGDSPRRRGDRLYEFNFSEGVS